MKQYSAILNSWEQDAYNGGYGADWLEEVGESVRVYSMDCENNGKRPTFAGLIRYLEILHRGAEQKDWNHPPEGEEDT